MSLDESRIEDVPQLTTDENDISVAPFSEKEVFEAIAQMKAYDKVKWPLLQQALRMKGFDEAWRHQVKSFTQKGSV